jgi:hypothetical protein
MSQDNNDPLERVRLPLNWRDFCETLARQCLITLKESGEVSPQTGYEELIPVIEGGLRKLLDAPSEERVRLEARCKEAGYWIGELSHAEFRRQKDRITAYMTELKSQLAALAGADALKPAQPTEGKP